MMNNGGSIKNIIPLFLGPKYKSHGKVVWRLIRDAKREVDGYYNINRFQLDRNAETKMPLIKYLCFLAIQMGVGCWFFKRDLKNAFRLLGLILSDWKFAGYYHNGCYFCDTRQIWGTRVACKWCNELVQLVGEMFKHLFTLPDKPLELENHVDDFMGMTKTKEDALLYTNSLAKFCNVLGLNDNPEKPEGPAQELKLVGIMFKSVPSLVLYFPNEKRIKLFIKLTLWRINKFVGTKEFDSVLGSINWFCILAWPLKAFTRRLIEFNIKLKQKYGDEQNIITELPNWVWKDLKVHYNYLKIQREIPMENLIRKHKTSLIAYTDGATNGSREKGWQPGIGGLILSDMNKTIYWFSERVPTYLVDKYLSEYNEAVLEYNIQNFEMLSVVSLIYTYTEIIKKHPSKGLLIYNDNSSTVRHIIKKSARNEFNMACVRWLINWLAVNQIWIKIDDISTKDNYLADALSRFDLQRFFNDVKHEKFETNNKASKLRIPPVWKW